MTDLDLPSGARRRSLFAGLLEDRFTNIDLVVVLAALMITGFIGALSGVALAH